jgi:hypothetical protein
MSEDERAKLAETTDGDVREMKISIIKPKERKRETVGVGAKGDAREEGSSENPNSPESPDSPELPDEPEVLPDVPDAPPEKTSDAIPQRGLCAPLSSLAARTCRSLLPDDLDLAGVGVDAKYGELAEGALALPWPREGHDPVRLRGESLA